MDRNQFQAWLDRYVEAWKTYDPDQIGSLFSEDATYAYHPKDEPERGRAAILEAWFHQPDEKGTYDAKYEVLAIDGDTYVAQGRSDYFETPGGPLRDQYFNVYVCRFNEAGECTEFVEHWIQSRDIRAKQRADLIAKVKSGEVTE